MSHYIVKADRAEDWYAVWSDNVDAPIAWGTRAELEAPVLRDHLQLTPERFARADQYGSSARFGGPIYGWGDDAWSYGQRGILRRDRLKAACERLTADEDDPITDLLEPFEDETEVRPA